MQGSKLALFHALFVLIVNFCVNKFLKRIDIAILSFFCMSIYSMFCFTFLSLLCLFRTIKALLLFITSFLSPGFCVQEACSSVCVLNPYIQCPSQSISALQSVSYSVILCHRLMTVEKESMTFSTNSVILLHSL